MTTLSTSLASTLLKRCSTLSRTAMLPTALPRIYLSTSNALFQSTTPVDINQTLQKLVASNKVVVFMKGIPEEPKCGFSNAVVQILRMHGVNNYDSHNVLADEGIRQGIKDFSNWPTIPQVYVNGEFVGGCDIMIQMHQNGELIELLQKVDIKSALAESEQPGDSQK